jgi:hypothetical protein
VGSGNKNKSKVQYMLKKRDGHVADFTPYRGKKITGDAVSIDLSRVRSLFPDVAGSLESPEGPIHMLVGMDHRKDTPREQARKEVVMLYQSEFGTGHVACKNMGGAMV